MRASAKYIFIVVIVSFGGFMIFNDLGMGGSGGVTQTDDYLVVNGRGISYQIFQQRMQDAREAQRAQGVSIGESLEAARALEDQVVDNIILGVLLEDEFRRRNIRVTDEEIIAYAQQFPPRELMAQPEFLDPDGRFDQNRYVDFLATAAPPDWLQALENNYRSQIPELKLRDQLAADLYVPASQLWAMYRDQFDSATVRLMELQPDAAVDDSSVAVTDDEVRDYYNDNQEEFQRPPVAFTSYVTISRLTIGADTAAAAVRALELKVELDGGASFEDVARFESADTNSVNGGSAARGGDLGMVERGIFDSDFEVAALALQPGEISDPIPTQFGWHIIRLESAPPDSIHASHILIPVELAGDHLVEVESKADTLDLLAAEQQDPTILDDVADRLGLAVFNADPVIQGNRISTAHGIAPDGGIWAFEASVGETSAVAESFDAYYLFRLDSLRPEGVPELEEIEPQVRFAAMRAKKWEIIRTMATQIAADLRSGQPLMDAALQNVLGARTLGPMTRLVPDPQLNRLPQVVGAAFGLGVGQASGPIETESGIYFVEPSEISLADSTAWMEQLEEQRNAVIQTIARIEFDRLLLSLRASADIEDLRRDFDRRSREFERKLEENPNSPFIF